MKIARRLTTALVATLPLPLLGQMPPDAAERVDEIFADWTSVASPGCAVGVASHGLTVLERAYGMADLEHGVPNTTATIFEGGSLSKQFTSAAVVLLALDGKLRLEDDVRTYVPEVPDYGRTITLRHLMTHTSGLRDWGSVAAISGWGREQRTHDHDWVLDIVSRQRALNFEPGAQYSYSNTGYNLLAVVVSRVSGMSFADFSRVRIFEPLGLDDTQWRDDYRRLVPGRSSAYERRPDGSWEINRPIEHVHGNGGILTTVGDLLRWNRALTDARFGPDFVRMMEDTGTLNDGNDIVYASGLRVDDVNGLRVVSHTGSTAGYRAFLARYPDHGLSVAMLCNAGNVSTGGTGTRIARAYLGDAWPEAPVVAQGVSVPAETLRGLAGLYREPVTGEPLEITYADGSLRVGRTPLVARSATEFDLGASGDRFVFEPTGDGRPRFRVEAWTHVELWYEPVEASSPTRAQLASYAGVYHSDDAETTLEVRVEDAGLVVWQRPGRTRALTPLYPDAFGFGAGTVVRFRRGASGAVTELSLSLGRVFDMRFTRLEG